jgi:hypothetical protein
MLFHSTPQEIRHDNRDIFRAGEKVGGLPQGALLKIRNRERGGGGGEEEGERDEKEEEKVEEGEGEGEEKCFSPSSSLSSLPPTTPTLPLHHNVKMSSSSSSSSSSTSPPFLPSSSSSSSCSHSPSLHRHYHTVQPNEKIEDIARQHNITLMDLRKWNRSHFPTGECVHMLPPGTMLVIYPSESQQPQARRKVHTQTHTHTTKRRTLPIAILAAVGEEGERREGGGRGGRRREEVSISPE